MSETTSPVPPHVIDGGCVDLDAEAIEAKLNAVWQRAREGIAADTAVTKLSLANMLVIADAASRVDAERVAGDMARRFPSRVIFAVIDESGGAYSAVVRTSCNRDHETGMIRCFEIIELYADRSKVQYLPGALRSLLVGSVPVVTVDLRAFQSTPQFDETVLELSDFYFLNAEVVPTGPFEQKYLPLRWYRTLPVRELFDELMARAVAADCRSHPAVIVLYNSSVVDNYVDLLTGWLLARLKVRQPVQQGNRISATYRGYTVAIEIREGNGPDTLVAIEYGDGRSGAIERLRTNSGEFVYRGLHHGATIQREKGLPTLAAYVVEAIQDGSEFSEFLEVVKALDRIELSR